MAILTLLSVVLDDEPPAILSHTTKSKEPDRTQCLNGFKKPIYSFPQMITKALVLFPGRRATALSICDRIADMQPYYKYLGGNWKKLVYSSLERNKNIFACSMTSENGEYIWEFNPNFEKFLLDKWLPNYLQNKAKLVTQTDIIVESEILGSSPTVASNTKVSSVNSFDPDIIVESEILAASPALSSNAKVSSVNSLTDVIVESEIFRSSPTMKSSNSKNSSSGCLDILRTLCEPFPTNTTSKFPMADNTQQFLTEGFQPPNRLTSSEQNFTCYSAGLDQFISKPGDKTQYGTGSSLYESSPEFALADPVQLEDYQPDEINLLESESTVSGRPTIFTFQTAKRNILTCYM